MEKENLVENNKEEQKPFNLFDLILIFLKHKKKILIFTGIVCVISIIYYFFIADLIYYSDASIRSTIKSGGLLSSIESDLPDIGALGDIGLNTSKSGRDIILFEEILKSRRCLEPLIIKFDLMNKNKYKYMEDAINDFSISNMTIKGDKLSGILTIGVYDKDPKIAKDEVEFLLDELDKINIEMNVQNAKSDREFIEKRYNQAKEDLTKAEDTLKSFQIIYGVAPDLQVKASAQSAFTLEADLKTEEVKLDVLKKILSPDQIEVKTKEAEINSLKEQLSKIQNSTDLNDFLRLGNSPQIVMSFLRLEREVEIQSKIVSILLPIYEQAKIEENRATPTIQILDKPNIAEKKVKPKRLTMVFILTFISFSIFFCAFVIFEKFNKKTFVFNKI